ncbi:uncharacterized protein METZ01_LOCUS263225, partial [marine metagenome]
ILGANREEVYSRPSAPPACQQQQRAFAGTDLQAGGTWLGVSETGVVVAVTNRRESLPAEDPRSRGHLCFDTLQHPSASTALDWAQNHLETTRYRACNLLIADIHSAGVVHVAHTIDRRDLGSGHHVLADVDIDDTQSVRVQRARALATQAPATAGTVSACVLAIPTSGLTQGHYRFAAGPPDTHPFEDLSTQLRSRMR